MLTMALMSSYHSIYPFSLPFYWAAAELSFSTRTFEHSTQRRNGKCFTKAYLFVSKTISTKTLSLFSTAQCTQGNNDAGRIKIVWLNILCPMHSFFFTCPGVEFKRNWYFSTIIHRLVCYVKIEKTFWIQFYKSII